MERAQGCRGIGGGYNEFFVDASTAGSQTGSSETHTYRFNATPIIQTQSPIRMVDDTANGTSFVVLEAGNFGISITINNSSSASFGVSKNYIPGSNTQYTSLTSVNQLGIAQNSAANVFCSHSVQAYLKANDVLRVHSDGLPGTGGAKNCIRIVRIS